MKRLSKSLSALILAAILLFAALPFAPEAAEVAAFSPETSLFADNYTEINFDSTNGLPTSAANVVLQDSSGYIWIGSYGGLIRYDGSRFVTYTKKDGLCSSSVRSLFEDSAGRLWIGTNDHGACCYSGGAFSELENLFSSPSVMVRAITEDSDGNIYFGTAVGLTVLAKDGAVFHVAELNGETVQSLSPAAYGIVWGVTASGSVFATQNGELIVKMGSAELAITSTPSTVLARSAFIYVGTDTGMILRLSYPDLSAPDLNPTVSLFSAETFDLINCLYAGSGQRLWIATDKGLGYIENGQLHMLNLNYGSSLQCVFEDYEGNIWACSSRHGVLHLVESRFYNFGAAAELTGSPVNSTALYGGLLYVAKDDGLSVIGANGRVTDKLTEMLDGCRIRCLLADSAGYLWICTYKDYGIIRYNAESGEILPIRSKERLVNDKVRSAVELSDGSIAVCTADGLSLIKDGAVTASFAEAEGLTNPVILSLAEGADGSIYAGSDGAGIFVLSRGDNGEYAVTKTITSADGLPAEVILRITRDAEAGGFWVCASSHLCFILDSGRIISYDEFDFSSGSMLDAIIFGDTLWAVRTTGIAVFNRSALIAGNASEYELLDRADGLSGAITANSWPCVDGDGYLYLCAGDGVYAVKSDATKIVPVAPKVIINSIDVDGKITQSPTDIVIPDTARRITVEFAALSFDNREVKIEYRLDGFDTAPLILAPGEPLSVSYTNLPGRQYTFRLSASADGWEGAEATLSIRKQLSLIEKWYTLLSLSVLGAAAIFLLVWLSLKINSRKHLKKQAEYRNITRQALETIAQTIDAKDKYTNGHSRRVAEYSSELARRLGMSEHEAENIYYTGLLHDIGKIAIPDNILNKPGKLTPEEFRVITTHPQEGYEILKNFTAIPNLSDGARYHHEKYDGTGYLAGLAGENIPLIARIIGVADAYDAMSTARVYRPAYSTEYILEEFARESGKQFDPKIADIMVRMIKEKTE